MEKLSCIILAGGESRRMGEDKGLKIFNNQPLVFYAIQLAKKVCNNIYISTNNSNYKQFGYPILNDIFPAKGPMGGIYSGLSRSSTEWNLFLPCDTPFLSLDLLMEMKTKAESYKIIVPKVQDRIHPLVGFYHKDLLPTIKNHLDNNKLKMLGLLNETETYYQEINQDQAHSFANLNTLDELKNNEF
jgi:molybdenum cofactor guanylyltransferase